MRGRATSDTLHFRDGIIETATHHMVELFPDIAPSKNEVSKQENLGPKTTVTGAIQQAGRRKRGSTAR